MTDHYTDPTGRVCYVETTPGTVSLPNPALESPQLDVTYVVHPTDGRYAVVLRTDAQARLIEIVADPLAPVGTYGPDEHPFTAVLGAWLGPVSPSAVLASVGGPVADGLASLAAQLADAVSHGQHVAVRVQVAYLGTGAVPSQLQVDYAIDGHSASQSFSNT